MHKALEIIKNRDGLLEKSPSEPENLFGPQSGLPEHWGQVPVSIVVKRHSMWAVLCPNLTCVLGQLKEEWRPGSQGC